MILAPRAARTSTRPAYGVRSEELDPELPAYLVTTGAEVIVEYRAGYWRSSGEVEADLRAAIDEDRTLALQIADLAIWRGGKFVATLTLSPGLEEPMHETRWFDAEVYPDE